MVTNIDITNALATVSAVFDGFFVTQNDAIFATRAICKARQS